MRGFAIAQAMKNVTRLRRMLTIGTTFIHEPLLLAITIRVELGLFAQFLTQRGEAPDFHLSAIDDELRRVAGHHEFRSAQAAAKVELRRADPVVLAIECLVTDPDQT